MVKPNIDIDSSNPVNNGREDPLQKILPKVRFNCSGRPESYYADPDFNCEVFHYCKTNGFRFTFVCPPRSQFNQKHMTCDYDKPGDALCSKPSNESLTSTDNYSNQSPASIDSELITVLGSTERPFTPITPSASPTPSYSSPEWPNSGPSTVSSDKHDSAYGFEPLEHGQPYGHFPSLGSTDEEDFNRGNSHEVQETSKKTSFADPPSDIENSYKSSPKPNHDIVSVSTESIPDIAVSSGSPKSRIPIGYSSPMPDIDETSNKDSSGGFKPVFMDKGSGSGGPRKYSTVAPPILEIEAADNSGKVDLPSSMTTGSPFSVGPAYSTSLTPSYSPSTPVFSTSFSSPSTSSSSPSSSPPSASFSPSTTTPMPATSATPIQQSTISSPPRSKYHSLDDGNDLKPLTKITVQPIDLNYLNSNRNLKPKATSNSQRTSQRQPPSTSSNTYFSRPITSKVKDDYNNNNKVTSNGKGNGNQNNLHNVKSRVNKPTKYSTYSLFNDIRSDSRNSLTNGKTSHHASKSSFEPILGLTQFGQYTPSYLENIDRGAYPLNFNRSRPLVLSGQSSASSVATAASTPSISSAFLESQAAKFAQIAKLNLEKSNSHRDPFAFDYTALSQTDLPIFHPVYDQFHPGGQRSTLATVNSQLQEKFVSEKEQLFKKLRQQYAQDQIRKQLHQSLTDHVQQQGQQQQSNTLTGANLFANSGKPLTSLGSAPVMATSASTPLQQMTQSTSLIPSVTLEEEEAKYPDYFYGLPKLSALSQPSSMPPGKSTSIPKFDGNLLHSVANGQNTGSQFSTFNNPFVSESNDANKKQPIEPYRLPIGKRPANPVQATSSSSLVSSLQRLPWVNSKNSPVAPDNNCYLSINMIIVCT
ncbi:flocculation protein FLO11-like isoform X2 [Tetranychus urticae]|nr:flocculation protein FLO11-like isoform X2 [Tetranychus urticae]XP_025018533.1 flocculation protein FLO11-like isoform X2 [Tetranychus urticae]XP_025018534.1 flocculation protein FLO11-like isoform X2 [Tetranychus urticae]